MVGQPRGDSSFKKHTQTSACAHFNLRPNAISNGLRAQARKGLGKPNGTWQDAQALVGKLRDDGSGKKHTKSSACAHYNLPPYAISNGLQSQARKGLGKPTGTWQDAQAFV